MKLLFGFIIGAAILAIVVALYCALIIAGRSNEYENEGNNNEGYGDMFLKKQICPRCKTGKYTYDLDPKWEICPYIGCWIRNKCHFYKPLDKPSKSGIFKRNKNKATVIPEKFKPCTLIQSFAR